MFARRQVLLLCCLTASLSASAQGFVSPVAGLQPDRRPDAAPVVRNDLVDASIKQARLIGITTPWPGNVERIAEQGAWYSPMFRPGMVGPYDLRGWHTSRLR